MIDLLFEAQVRANPDAVAVRHNGASTTYRSLNAAANRLARRLLAAGVQPEEVVGIVADHSERMAAAILAAIKSGAAYAAMEPDFPRERIAFVLGETLARFVLCDRAHATLLPEGVTPIFLEDDFAEFSAENPAVEAISGTSALYVLYTSGTTGTPKGVVIEHRNVANYVRAFAQEFGLTPRDRMLQCSVCTFDIFVEEFYPILLSGGTLVIASREERADAALLAELMRREEVTLASGFPYLWRELQEQALPASLRVAISGGDVLCPEHIAKIAQKIPVYNTYGPSETTVCATYYRYNGETGAIPIGKAIHGVRVDLSSDGQIVISGAGVGRGYLKRPAETAAAFTPKGYLTGDLGRRLPDGNIEFLGRKDRQVMIRGKRVEPAEVEGVMARAAGVERVAVQSLAPNVLAAYWVGEPVDWRAYLSQYLTSYMIPAHFIRLEAMPLTLSGKVDYAALPRPVVLRRATSDDLQTLLALREEVLVAVFGLAGDYDFAALDTHNYFTSGDYAILLAMEGERIAGCGAICFYRVMPSPDSPSGLCATIMNMYTRPEYRRRGIASQIVGELVELARERRATRLTLETTALGKHIYQRHGFAPNAEEMELTL